MTLYALFAPRPGRDALPEAVPESFSWLAAVLPPVHALAHGLWDQLALWLGGVAVLVLASRLVGEDAAAGLYLLLALALGFAAPGARARALRRRRYAALGYRVAADADLARLAAMEGRP